MSVTAVVRVLTLIVIFRIAEFIIEFGFKAVLHELGYSLFEKLLNILHAADVGGMEQFAYLGFFRSLPVCGSFSSLVNLRRLRLYIL